VGWLAPIVRVGGALAALGSLLVLILGVSATSFAMARDRHLPPALDAVHSRYQAPHWAELAVLVVALLAAVVDLRSAIGFSSFGVLLYHGIANAAGSTLTAKENRPARVVPVVGLTGCLLLAVTLPLPAVVTGAAVIAIGALLYATRHRPGKPPTLRRRGT
jgi:APA family basic amino acid/polyamine antiporter